jgi:hypothetical protein
MIVQPLKVAMCFADLRSATLARRAENYEDFERSECPPSHFDGSPGQTVNLDRKHFAVTRG